MEFVTLLYFKINTIKESNWTAFFYFFFKSDKGLEWKSIALASILTFVSPWPIYVLSTLYSNCLPKPQVGFDTILTLQ